MIRNKPQDFEVGFALSFDAQLLPACNWICFDKLLEIHWIFMKMHVIILRYNVALALGTLCIPKFLTFMNRQMHVEPNSSGELFIFKFFNKMSRGSCFLLSNLLMASSMHRAFSLCCFLPFLLFLSIMNQKLLMWERKRLGLRESKK